MTGPEHYTRAEQLLREVRDGHQEGTDVAAILAAAQAHATLAQAAATAMSGRGEGMHSSDFGVWDNVAGIPVSSGGDA
ncbi:hypothetical protein [Streptomyces flaveolus]|uniref:hypothetical protein n=1 Tax=Streptomyces flaveolus TaxID=67297 RepID=UPI0034381CEF